MTTILFLAEWALRSSILILSGALLLWMLRVKDPSIRLASWTVMLCASLVIPALTTVLPNLPLLVMRTAAPPAQAPAMVHRDEAEPAASTQDSGAAKLGVGVSNRYGWSDAAVMAYVLVAGAFLLRLCVGLAMSLRWLGNSRVTDRKTEGIEIRESDRVSAPVTLGIIRPAIVLPSDWRQWDGTKLDAVLAHERSHIRRHDPAVQLLSAIHRALLWHSPLSWFLHKRLVRTAEEASDDAAVAVTRDRALYAEVLLDFIQRGTRGANWLGVPMARYGQPDERIQRILDGTALSGGVTRWSAAAILALGSPLAYVVAAAQPQSVVKVETVAAPSTTVRATINSLPVQPASPKSRENSASAFPGGGLMASQAVSQSVPAAKPQPETVNLMGLGEVAAFYTVTVKPRVDGQLLSMGFKEGDLVQAGQLLASIDPRPYQVQLDQAKGQLARDQAQLAEAKRGQSALVAQLEGSVRTDQANVDNAKLQMTYTQIHAPITGVAGLRRVDPGNIVFRDATAAGIVIITQLQPIAVLFTIPEDNLPQVRTRLREGASVLTEAWDRTGTAKIATGRLTAVDNQIDQASGTAKLKAVFDNRDDKLFPGQFVNVRLLLSAR